MCERMAGHGDYPEGSRTAFPLTPGAGPLSGVKHPAPPSDKLQLGGGSSRVAPEGSRILELAEVEIRAGVFVAWRRGLRARGPRGGSAGGHYLERRRMTSLGRARQVKTEKLGIWLFPGSVEGGGRKVTAKGATV